MIAVLLFLAVLGFSLYRLYVHARDGSRLAVFYAILCLMAAILFAGLSFR